MSTAVSTRDRLMEAALCVVEEGGYAAASVATIAERAGFAVGALYFYFPSKAELFVEVFRAVAERELNEMRAAAAQHPRFSERFPAVISTYAHRALRARRLAWALVYEPVDPLVDVERLSYRRDFQAEMAALLQEGVAAGDIPQQDLELAAAAVVGAIAESLVSPLAPLTTETTSGETIVGAIVTFCERAIGMRRSQEPRSSGGP